MTWMIWGTPLFRKPPYVYIVHQEDLLRNGVYSMPHRLTESGLLIADSIEADTYGSSRSFEA